MKILLTGGAGYLGSVLVPKLLAENHEVTVFDILMFGGEALLPYLNNKAFRLIIGDIRDSNCIKKTLESDFDAVIHLAALVGEPACKINPKLTKEINYQAAIYLARQAKKAGVKRFIFSSTCSNYGIARGGQLASENSQLVPLSLYAETKIAAEEELTKLNDQSYNVTILRLATLFGVSPKMRFNLLINEMVRDAWYQNPIKLYKSSAWRPYTHIEDAAEAIICVINSKEGNVNGQIFNVGTENVQKKTLAKIVKKYLPQTEILETGGVADNRDYRVSFKKIIKALGFRPQKTVKDGINELIRALKDHVFFDPYDKKYNSWLDQSVFK